jgi:hypothetical protein
MTRSRPLAALLTLLAFAAPAAAGGGLRCTLEAPARVKAGAPVVLRFTLSNTGAVPVWVLDWNTPFEGQGWFAPYVELMRDGAPVPYRGPTLKRGEPSRDHYFLLAAGAARSASVDLALPFDLSQPGRYRVRPRLQLHDVVQGAAAGVPRPRGLLEGRALACNPVNIEVETSP